MFGVFNCICITVFVYFIIECILVFITFADKAGIHDLIRVTDNEMSTDLYDSIVSWGREFGL